MTLSIGSTPITGTLTDFTSEFIAICAEQHFQCFPQSTKGQLMTSLRAELEARFAEEPDNQAGYDLALTTLADADEEGVLEPEFG